jgi:hypothetical protein
VSISNLNDPTAEKKTPLQKIKNITQQVEDDYEKLF